MRPGYLRTRRRAVATTQAALAGDKHYRAMIQGTTTQLANKGRVLLPRRFFSSLFFFVMPPALILCGYAGTSASESRRIYVIVAAATSPGLFPDVP